MTERRGSIVIEGVSPELDGGRHRVKRVAGDKLRIEADVFKEGHDVLAAVIRWRPLTPKASSEWNETPMQPLGNDRWAGEIALAENGRYAYTIEAWPDLYRTWVSEVQRKLAAGRDVQSELLEGKALLEGAAERADRAQARPDA